ncbi:MAG: ATP-dependent DNA helicase [Candidatus Magasanikbacteria bacterium]
MDTKQLNKAQKEAIEYVDGPLLIVAGAGTGKTTVVTEKIAHLINSGLAKPEEILAITFTDKAAGEMEERVDQLLSIGYVDIQISTFHSFCQRLLEDFGMDIGLSRQFRLLTQTEAWLLVRENLDTFNLDYYRPLGSPTRHIHELISHFEKCKDELVSPREYLEYVEGLQLDKDDAEREEKNRLSELADAYHTYNQLLLDNAVMDFADLIYYAVKLLQEKPTIKQTLQKRFKYILVDEFQDVNWSQYKLIQLLAENSQLTTVGDDDQAIYSFRGASVSNILQFKEDYPNAKEIVLKENYRSEQGILDASYTVIQNNNPDRLETKLHIDKKLISKKKKSVSSNESQVEHLHFESLEDEVQGVVDQILSIKEKDEDATWDDFAILVRANNHATPFLHALDMGGIPYEFLASSGLYRQPIVMDALAFFTAVDNKNESRAIFRLMCLPFLEKKEEDGKTVFSSMTQSDFHKILTSAKKKSLLYYEALKRAREFGVSDAGVKIANKIIDFIHQGMKDKNKSKPSSLLLRFMEDSGYFHYITTEENNGNADVIRQIYQLKQFFTLLEKYEQTIPDSHVMNFLENYNNIIDAGDQGELYQPKDTPESLNVMTIHGAKGLEYKYVFVVNMVEERMPTRRRGPGIEIPIALIKEHLPEGDIHYQEERRLFYVAMTRAKEKLFLTSAHYYGGIRKKKTSRFIGELQLESFTTNTKLNETTELVLDESIGKRVAKSARRESDEEEKGEFIYELPKAYSFSQIKAYETCPYQYKLSHLLKIPTRGNGSFSFGSTMHNTLHEFYKKVQELNNVKQATLFGGLVENTGVQSNVKVPSLGELYDMYDRNWIEDWYRDKREREDYYKKGKDILKIFYASEDGHWTIPVTLEGWFKIKVGEYLVHGRIDRIDKLEDGTLQIIDYKTGTTKEKLVGEEKDQLLIYQIAASTLKEYRNIGEVSKLTFHYLNDNVETSFFGTNKELEKLQEKMLEIISGIQKKDFTATPSQFACQHCDFRDICEFKIL